MFGFANVVCKVFRFQSKAEVGVTSYQISHSGGIHGQKSLQQFGTMALIFCVKISRLIFIERELTEEEVHSPSAVAM